MSCWTSQTVGLSPTWRTERKALPTSKITWLDVFLFNLEQISVYYLIWKLDKSKLHWCVLTCCPIICSTVLMCWSEACSHVKWTQCPAGVIQSTCSFCAVQLWRVSGYFVHGLVCVFVTTLKYHWFKIQSTWKMSFVLTGSSFKFMLGLEKTIDNFQKCFILVAFLLYL